MDAVYEAAQEFLVHQKVQNRPAERQDAHLWEQDAA
jgi:hypothetical protein